MATSDRMLRAVLVLGGAVDKSLDKALREASAKLTGFGEGAASIGDKFTAAGKLMTSAGKIATLGITAPLVALGKSSVNLYTDFDDMMRKVAAASNATEKEFKALTEAAAAGGATTRFTATDAAEALYYLSQAGWDANKSMQVLPQLLDLAAAGSLELGDAANLIVNSMAALQIETDNLDEFIDQLAETSRNANASLAQFGEGILTIGGTANMMNGGVVELNATLGVLANRGIKGAEGGTKLRNVLLSLAAPTDKAASLMASLGASEADLQEALADFDIHEAQKMMEELGFSAFTLEGQFKPIEQIFTELNEAVDGMSDADRAKVLSTIFNKRDLVAVEALLAGVLEEYTTLKDEIANSKGAAGEMAETLEGGLGGTMRELESAIEEVKRQLGEKLAPHVDNVAKWLNDMALAIAGMDPEKFDALLAFLVGIAGAGPGLLIVGGAAKGVGSLLTQVKDFMAGTPNAGMATTGLKLLQGIGAFAAAHPAGALIAAAAGTALLIKKLYDLDKAANEKATLENLAAHFGSISIDAEQVTKDATEAAAAYTAGLDQYVQGATSIEASVTQYETQVARLGELLIQGALKKELSSEEKQALYDQGVALAESVTSTITGAWNRSLAVSDATIDADNPLKENIEALINAAYSPLEARSKEVGQQLHGHLLASLADGVFSQEDKVIADNLVRELNAIEAEAAMMLGQQDLARILVKTDYANMDMDSYMAIQDEMVRLRDERAAVIEDMVLKEQTILMHGALNMGLTREDIAQSLEEAEKGIWDTYGGAVDTLNEYIGRHQSMGIAALLSKYAEDYKGFLDPDALEKMMSETLYYQYGPEYLKAPGAENFLRDVFSEDWLTDYLLMNVQQYGENGRAVDLQDAFKKMLEQLDPNDLYAQREAAIEAGRAVPKDVAKGIADYESLKEISESADALYAWILDAVSGGAALELIYRKLFGIGASFPEVLADGMHSGMGSSNETDPFESLNVPSRPSGRGVPAYADGGVITRPTLGLVGDYPESIIPHRHDANTLSLLQGAAAASGFGMGGIQINLSNAPTIHTTSGEAGIMTALKEHARELADMIMDEMERRRKTTF